MSLRITWSVTGFACRGAAARLLVFLLLLWVVPAPANGAMGSFRNFDAALGSGSFCIAASAKSPSSFCNSPRARTPAVALALRAVGTGFVWQFSVRQAATEAAPYRDTS